MAGFEREKQHFPLKKIQDVVDLFKEQLLKNSDTNLSLLSIILGTIENTLTVNRTPPISRDTEAGLEPIFPIVQWETIEVLHTKFVTLIKSFIDLSKYPGKFATRELVKSVSDVIWCSLTRTYYKDKAHLQSLYSFLTGNKLDCFGVAFAVVAAFQVLGYDDVHLALSEDHAWVVFGEDGDLSAEVTWHGKGNEDKRGQPITGGVSEKRWLYLNGKPVVCTRHMEVAAIVSGINPSISQTVDSVEVGGLQQELLWLLYDQGHIAKYPMALGNLGDLEEIRASPGRPPPTALFQEAMESARQYYDDQHVYPYTYLGGHMYRQGHYRDALHAWADAAAVVKKYNYNREDEEIYKEFIEIANDWIPTMMRVAAADNSTRMRRTSLLCDTKAYASFLRFYDGICGWEEESATPVLHIVWAKQLVFSLGKFDPRVRKCIQLHADGVEEESSSEESSSEDEVVVTRDENENGIDKVNRNKRPRGRKSQRRSSTDTQQNGLENGVHGEGDGKVSGSSRVNGNTEEEHIKSTIEELVSKVGEESETPNPNMAALAQACGESILNPDYLITGGEPFTSTAAAPATTVTTSTSCDTKVDVNEFLSTRSNGTQFIGMTVDSMLKAESPADMMFRGQPDSAPASDEPEPVSDTTDVNCKAEGEITSSDTKDKLDDSFSILTPEPYELTLYSEKMKGLRKLFASAKLNSSAINLQLTAQSQTQFKHSKRGAEVDYSLPRKRTRRDVVQANLT